MDPQSVPQQGIEQPMPEYVSPARRNTFIIVGVVFLILLIVVGVIFLLVRPGANNSQPRGGTPALSPQPTPSFYELISTDIQKQELKLNDIGNEINELTTVFAYEPVNFSDVLTPAPVNTAEWETQKIEIAKARAELEIDRRIATLDKLSSKVNSSEKLSSTQKTLLASELDVEIASLSSLKTRILDKTNFSALTVDINILSESFKNYQVLAPKVLIAIIADKINVFGDSFTNIAEKLAQKTGELNALGKDITDVQKTLGHLLFVLGDAANKSEAATVSVLPLSSSDYPKNKAILLDAKGKLQASQKNLSLALSDGKNIVNALVTIESGKTPRRNFFQFFPLFGP